MESILRSKSQIFVGEQELKTSKSFEALHKVGWIVKEYCLSQGVRFGCTSDEGKQYSPATFAPVSYTHLTLPTAPYV